MNRINKNMCELNANRQYTLLIIPLNKYCYLVLHILFNTVRINILTSALGSQKFGNGQEEIELFQLLAYLIYRSNGQIKAYRTTEHSG